MEPVEAVEPVAPARPSPGIGARLLGVLRWAVVVVGVLAGLLAYMTGQLLLVLLVLLLIGAAWGLAVRGIAALQGRLTLAAWRRPLDPSWRPARLQAVNRALFWIMAALVIAWTIPEILIEPDEAREIRLVAAAAALLGVATALLPARRAVRPAWNVLPLLGWLFLGAECLRILAGPPGPLVELAAPFDGEWGVGQGGRGALVNHHYAIPAQSHALDLARLERGRACTGDPQRLESYPAFGAVLLAPADGTVARAVDGHADMAIGQTDRESLVGNHVVIEIGPGRYALLAHLQRGSVAVEPGQAVRAGEVVGRCGNSGNTSQPHLHLQVQNRPDFRARDLRTFPMAFRGARLLRGGAEATGSPRRNDRIVADRAG